MLFRVFHGGNGKERERGKDLLVPYARAGFSLLPLLFFCSSPWLSFERKKKGEQGLMLSSCKKQV